MAKKIPAAAARYAELPKSPTGIRGLDQIIGGGLPRGRPLPVCGGTGTGTGKTLLGVEFLARGATEYGESGVFVSFEERPMDLAENTASLGLDLESLISRKKLHIEEITIDASKILETGEFELDRLFIRLGASVDDGLDELKRLRADEHTGPVPVVGLTSANEDRDVVDAYKLGANSLITKPVEFEAFVATVGKLGLYWLVVNKPSRGATWK